MKFLHIGLLVLFLWNCSPNEGEFGWAVTSDESKDVLERAHFQVTDFKMMRNNLIFSPNDTIHYVYKFQWSLFASNYSSGEEFVISLEKESLGFVEVEVKKKNLDPDSYSLKDKFSNLEIGRYIIKVAYEGDVIDSVTFDVLPEEGYSLKEGKNEEENDEILKYSR